MPCDDRHETVSLATLKKRVLMVAAVDVTRLAARSEVEDLLTTACGLKLALQARLERLTAHAAEGRIATAEPEVLAELASDLATIRVVVAEARRRLC